MRDEAPEAAPATPALLTEKQAARFLGFSARTLQSWRFRGGGPRYVSVSPRCVRYRLEDLRQWIEDRLRTSTADPGPEAGGGADTSLRRLEDADRFTRGR